MAGHSVYPQISKLKLSLSTFYQNGQQHKSMGGESIRWAEFATLLWISLHFHPKIFYNKSA